jgi:hypothetical protein
MSAKDGLEGIEARLRVDLDTFQVRHIIQTATILNVLGRYLPDLSRRQTVDLRIGVLARDRHRLRMAIGIEGIEIPIDRLDQGIVAMNRKMHQHLRQSLEYHHRLPLNRVGQ